MTTIHFQLEKEHQAYDIVLEPSDVWSPILIDGKHYQLLGDHQQLRWLQEQIPQFSNHESISLTNLRSRLTAIGAHELPLTEKTHAVGVSTLLPKVEQDKIEDYHKRLEDITTTRVNLQKKLKLALKEHPENVERLQVEVLEAKKTEMDAYLRYIEVKEHFRGSVLVKHHGEILIKEGYGPAAEKERPNTKDTRTFISSMGKMLTSSAIMRLMQEGRLSLDDKINERLPPEFRNPLWEGIEIRHLLTHTSGIPSYGPVSGDEQRTMPFTAEDIYKITLLSLFIEKKGLSENDEIYSRLPEKVRQDNWKGISVKDLLSHELGIPKTGEARYKDIEELYNFMIDPKHVKEIGSDLLFNPGEMFSYSNSGYVLLGQIIRYVSHKASYEAYMEDMFKQIKMDHSDFSYNEKSDANGFLETKSGMLTSVEGMTIHASKSNAAGGIVVTTVDDMEKFDEALYSDKFLLPITRDEMFKDQLKIRFDPGKITYDEKGRAHPKEGKGINHTITHYGFGFIVFKDREIVGHDGANYGFNSFFKRDRKEQDLMVILGNIDRDLVCVNDIADHLDQIIYS